MTKLRTLRSQLAALRASRQWMRLGTGYSALLIAILWVLLLIFAVDFGFHYFGFPLDAIQRAVILAVGAAGLVWAAMKYTAPYLGHAESDIDMALLVERQHGIDSDLVAALQFETDESGDWGSRELEDAVVDYVAQLDKGLNVYEGISHEEFYRRMGILAAIIAVVVGLVAYLPAHAHAFMLRLALDNIHYPSNTLIEHVLVNGEQTLSRGMNGTSPQPSSGVQGRSVVFAALVDGEIPAQGKVQFRSSGSGARELALLAVSQKEFEEVLGLLQGHVQPDLAASQREISDLSPDERADAAKTIAGLSSFEVARVEQSLKAADRYDPVLAESWRQLKHLNDAWQGADGDEIAVQPDMKLFVAKLPRLLDPAEYVIRLGDAWTDKAAISMTALPVVEPRFTEKAPLYASLGEEDEADPNALQRSVIEGSELSLVIGSSKPLEAAKFRLLDEGDAADEPSEFSLTKLDEADVEKYWPTSENQQPPQEVWRLPMDNSPLASITKALRYEIQVTDTDGLSLDTPLRGAIRLRADRPPRISGALVHRAVLPTATPEVEIRVDDDYGIQAMNIHISIRKNDDAIEESAAALAGDESSFPITKLYPLRGTMSPAAAAQRKGVNVPFPLQGESLPAIGAYKLDMSQMELQRGDQVRIVLEAIDYRGKPGESTLSEPIMLDITDESGILAAVSEGDRRSQEQIDDLIRRQLGIGEVD